LQETIIEGKKKMDYDQKRNFYTEKQLLISFYSTQGILLLFAVGLLWWQDRLQWDLIIGDEPFWWIFGVGLGFLIVVIESILMYMVPDEWQDDGGINRLLFKNRSVGHIFIIAVVSSFVEELLFRGAIQYWLGVWGTAFLFILLHVRYLKQWLLVLVLAVISLAFGYVVEHSHVLAPVILAHWLNNFCVGLLIRFSKQE
jgi:membrane protease YdiL (CAAX protease family)